MHLAELAEILAVGVDDGGGVVIDARHLLLVDRHHQHHAVFLRQLLHLLGRRAVGDALGAAIPFLVLARAEIGLREDLLEAQDLHALLGGLLDQRQMGLEHQLPDLAGRHRGVALEVHLDKAGRDLGHACLPACDPELRS